MMLSDRTDNSTEVSYCLAQSLTSQYGKIVNLKKIGFLYFCSIYLKDSLDEWTVSLKFLQGVGALVLCLLMQKSYVLFALLGIKT